MGEDSGRLTGQPVLTCEALLEASQQLETELVAAELARSAAHAAMLRRVRRLVGLYDRQGWGVGALTQLALLVQGSERRAVELHAQAVLLSRLSGAMAALQTGELTVEHCRVLSDRLFDLPPADADRVWGRVLGRLRAGRAGGQVFPPRRFDELVSAVLAELLPDRLAQVRREAEQRDADVTFDHRNDGLVDLHGYGISGPNAQAALGNLQRRAQPWGPDDPRGLGQRRRDALVDLLTGRDPLPRPGQDEPTATAAPTAAAGAATGDQAGDPDAGDGQPGCPRHAAGRVVDAAGRGHVDPRPAEQDPAGRSTVCGCPAGSPVPCGTAVQVLVPLSTALGLADLPALLSGPAGTALLDTGLLAAQLTNAPRLRLVYVDQHGVPVALGQRTAVPPVRHDPASTRQALLGLLGTDRPGRYVPTGPHDHPHLPDPPGPDRPAPHAPPGDPRGRAHPADQPTGYRIRPRLAELVRLRAPRCEFPGCGARAARCDLDHDQPWPHGPTCGCNLGPLCRRHHRVKQAGWTKTRNGDGSLTWVSPTGRSYHPPSQLPAPPAPTRATPSRPAGDPPLSPLQDEQERWLTDPTGRWWTGLDHGGWHPQHPEHDPHPDRLGDQITGSTDPADPWQLALADHTRWTGLPTTRPQPEPPDWQAIDGPSDHPDQA